MSYWNYIVICLSLLLWGILLWREIDRRNKARLTGRMIASTLLVTALAAMVLPVGYTSRPEAGAKEGVLLTEGYNPDSARIYLSSRTEVKDLKDPHVSVLHILGYGLTEEERAQLPDIPLLFHPSPMQTGIGTLHWKQQLLPGEPCRIQGSFYNATGIPVKLLLFGLNTLLDSAEIRSREGDFELRTVPVQSDRAVYTLMAVAGKDTLEQEPIPVEVLPEKELKILMLAASPDAENRFLAGWLSDKGHGVVVRTAISKDKYDHAYLNMSALAVDHLSAALLDKFDVVMADAVEWKTMSPAEHTCLWNAIAEKGLGLVIKADSASPGKERSLDDEPGGRPLIRDTLRRTLVSENMHGSGKIIRTALNATYAQLLAGERKEYAALWTHILQQAARRKEPAERWRVAPTLAGVDHPVKLSLQSTASLPQGLLEEEDGGTPVSVYLAQHPSLPFCWEGMYWPRKPGWQSVHTLRGERNWWYVWRDGDWKNIHRRERMEGTLQWVASRMAARSVIKIPPTAGTETQKVLVAKGWFYLLFVLCAVFLWVERKI